MNKTIAILFLLLSVNIYSYSLGVGFVTGGGATDIKALESTAKCSDCVNDFTYKYKYGVNIINKFELSETIFFKFNISLINFKIDFKKTEENPFLIKTDLALEFYPIKEILSGFHFSSGLFINYFLTDGFSEENYRFSMLSAFLGLGYRIPVGKNVSFCGDAFVEIFDIISIETKTKAYVGVSSNLYFLYDF